MMPESLNKGQGVQVCGSQCYHPEDRIDKPNSCGGLFYRRDINKETRSRLESGRKLAFVHRSDLV